MVPGSGGVGSGGVGEWREWGAWAENWEDSHRNSQLSSPFSYGIYSKTMARFTFTDSIRVA